VSTTDLFQKRPDFRQTVQFSSRTRNNLPVQTERNNGDAQQQKELQGLHFVTLESWKLWLATKFDCFDHTGFLNTDSVVR